MANSPYTPSDSRPFAFEFKARIIQASSASWRKDKDANGQPLAEPREMNVNKYSFTSSTISGVLVEWLDKPTPPAITAGECQIRFRQLRPSKQMFGFYELSGYPVIP